MQIIAKNIEEGNISRNMFDNGLNQIIGKLDPLFDDFKKSKSFGNFKTEVFRFTKEDA